MRHHGYVRFYDEQSYLRSSSEKSLNYFQSFLQNDTERVRKLASSQSLLWRVYMRLLMFICSLVISSNCWAENYHIIFVHGMWAKPESLYELSKLTEAAGFSSHFVKYDVPGTCEELKSTVSKEVKDVILKEKLDVTRTYLFGYSLGAMGIALSNVNVAGYILDAPANYSNAACDDLLSYVPGTLRYNADVLQWRSNSNNVSPATINMARSGVRMLVIGHVDDELIPYTTVRSFAQSPKSSIWWVPGGHAPDWASVSEIVGNFIMMDAKFALWKLH